MVRHIPPHYPNPVIDRRQSRCGTITRLLWNISKRIKNPFLRLKKFCPCQHWAFVSPHPTRLNPLPHPPKHFQVVQLRRRHESSSPVVESDSWLNVYFNCPTKINRSIAYDLHTLCPYCYVGAQHILRNVCGKILVVQPPTSRLWHWT